MQYSDIGKHFGVPENIARGVLEVSVYSETYVRIEKWAQNLGKEGKYKKFGYICDSALN